MYNYDIFNQLDNLIKKSKIVNESEITDDLKTDEEDYETAEGGVKKAIEQIIDRLLGDDEEPKGDGGGKTDIHKSDNPLSDVKKKTGGEGVDKTFKESTIDGMDDLDSVDDDSSDDSSLKDDDYEFDDFDYEDKKPPTDSDSDSADGHKGSGDEESSDEDYDYSDGDFDDSEMGDEDDYDFGDDSDLDFDSDSMSSDSKSSSDEDIDYDDTLDYDAEDYDTLESEIKDALDRISDGASTKSEKEKLKDMSDIFGDDSKETSPIDKADELSKEIDKAKDDSATGSGELAGETLDGVPDDKSLAEDMEKAGFDKKEIDKMNKSKDVDMSDNIDDEKVAKDAMGEMDKRAKERGEESGSSLSRTIMRGVLKGKISNMEWKEMVGIFLKSKSKSTGGTFAKSRSTSWGDKKHLWRDAVMPKSVVSGGDIAEINCFVDFSGSVSQPLVFTFLQRVLEFCKKLSFDVVNVYGFGNELSKPFVIKQRDLPKGKDEEKFQKFLENMWNFISEQNLGGYIENFEDVAKEILKIKRKDHDSPILIFGDGLWATSYPNPKPPMCLKELCSRYLKDILILIYYHDSEYYMELLTPEIGYLKDIVGLKHIVTTEIDELK